MFKKIAGVTLAAFVLSLSLSTVVLAKGPEGGSHQPQIKQEQKSGGHDRGDRRGGKDSRSERRSNREERRSERRAEREQRRSERKANREERRSNRENRDNRRSEKRENNGGQNNRSEKRVESGANAGGPR